MKKQYIIFILLSFSFVSLFVFSVRLKLEDKNKSQMNRIYLYGKVVFKSRLKYIIETKLKIYVEVIVKTSENNSFICVVNESNLDKLRCLNSNDYVYIDGYGIVSNKILTVVVNEIYVL